MARSSPEPQSFLPLTTVAFEILLSVAEQPLHGYAIMLAIEERTDGRLSLNPGTLYRALNRLVEQGLLERVRERPGRGNPQDDGRQETTAQGTGPQRRTGGAERHKSFRISALGARVAGAEAERLADQVGAAQARALLRKPETTT